MLALLAFISSAAQQLARPTAKRCCAWCAGCHGAEGMGDGPDAKGFNTEPSSLAAASYKRGTSDKAVLNHYQRNLQVPPWTAMATS